MPQTHVSTLYKASCWPTSFRKFWKKLKVKYLFQLHLKYGSYWLIRIKNTAVLNWTKINSEFTGIKRVDGQILAYKFCVKSYGFSFINAQGTQEFSQEFNKLKDSLDKWPKRGERITQNFGELISYTSQSQWPRGLRRGVCGRSLAGVVSSNTAEGMDRWVFRYRYLGRADYSCRRIIPTVVCTVSVIAKPRNEVEASRMAGDGGWGESSCTNATWSQKVETGTDSYGVCAPKLLGWHWFKIAFKGEL